MEGEMKRGRKEEREEGGRGGRGRQADKETSPQRLQCLPLVLRPEAQDRPAGPASSWLLRLLSPSPQQSDPVISISTPFADKSCQSPYQT